MGAYKYWNPATQKYEIIKSKSIVKEDGSLEYTPDDIKAIDNKIGILNGVGEAKEKANKVDLDSHKADLVSQEINKGASLIGLHDADNKFISANVEGAMSELFTNVSNGKDLVSGAITGVDDSVVIPTDPSFNDLASAISGISTGKKWASGIITYISTQGSEITNLEFVPAYIILYIKSDPNKGVFRSRNPNFGGGDFRVSAYQTSTSIFPRHITFRTNGFHLENPWPDKNHHNIYEQVTWLAIE